MTHLPRQRVHEPRGAERGGGVRWGLVWAIFAVTILVAMGAGAYLYFVLMRYERAAVRHVPAGSVAAVRWDVEQVVLYEPLRQHVLPVVDRRLATSGSVANPDGLDRLEAATKINLGRDLREIVVAQGPSPDDWVLAVGGMFATEGVVAGMVGLLQEQGQAWQLAGDHRTARGPARLALGQAEDGVVLLASSMGRLEAALAPTQQGQRLGLLDGNGGGFAVDLSSTSHGGVTRVQGLLLLGNPIEIDVVAALTPGSDRGRVAREIRALLATAGLRVSDRRLLRIPEAPVADLGPDRVEVRFPWERADIDASAREVARWLSATWPAPSRSRVE